MCWVLQTLTWVLTVCVCVRVCRAMQMRPPYFTIDGAIDRALEVLAATETVILLTSPLHQY